MTIPTAMSDLSLRFAQSTLAQADRLSYGELAVLADWLYADVPEDEKEPGLTWELAHHVEMARLLDTRNYARMRARVARLDGSARRVPLHLMEA